MADPWIITPLERSKHDEQFKTLGPVGGFITGEQAKGFFLQSRLPAPVLVVIWSLADMDGDGKMNQNEFSIACKLINLKLRQFNLPSILPPSLVQSACKAPLAQPSIPAVMPTMPPGVPTSLPPVGMPTVPPTSIAQTMHPMVPTATLIGGPPPVAPVMPISAPLAQTPVMPLSAPLTQAPVMPISASLTMAPVASVAPIMAPSVPQLKQNQVPLTSAVIPPLIPTGTISAPLVAPVSAPVVPVLASTSPSPVVPVLASTLPSPVVQATSEAPAASQPVGAPKAPMQDPGMEWGVPQTSKLKFTQAFNMSDRMKTGFLSGVQARNILIQSALPQQLLAQIWALADVDNDGRLSCEEFVLAMYLCEQAKAGKAVPTALPPELIPPTQRRSRTSSIHSQGSTGTGTATPGEGTLSPSSSQLISDTSFEDKRRENYEKGQAELDRRRKTLLDAQRRETEERLRREREEEMKREKARQEAERKRQEELEKEMNRQREIEALKEAERRRLEETKEQARKDAERQRQEEWEKQRLLELMNVRQRQQESLLALKAKNQSLTIEISTKDDKVKELTQQISETRTRVTEVKATIDNMRNTRDTYMSDMNTLKAQARDQNQRLLSLNQEKARLKARSLASAAASGAETAAVEASVTSKQMVIKQLQDKIQELEMELSTKEQDLNNNQTDFQSTKDQFLLTGERCKELYEEYSSKKKEVLALREKLLNPNAAWGNTGGTPWSGNSAGMATPPACSSSVSLSATSSLPTTITTSTTCTTTRHQEAPARPPQPSTLPGGVKRSEEVVSPPAQPLSTTPSWDAFATTKTNTFNVSTIPSTSEGQVPSAGDTDDGKRKFRALYQFDSRSADEISFNPGDIIEVIPTKDHETGWLSGKLNNKIGWFPEAYCEPYEGSIAEPTAPLEAVENQINGTVTQSSVPLQAKLNIKGEGIALVTWAATKSNQLNVNKGDKVILRESFEGWVFGELNGMRGWLPRGCLRIGSSPENSPLEAPNTPLPTQLDHNLSSEYYVAVYPYQSDEPGDLLFEAEETILVMQMEGDWWFGLIGERSGIFPSNYVQQAPDQLLGKQEVQSDATPVDDQKMEAKVESVASVESTQSFDLQKNDSLEAKMVEEREPLPSQGVKEEEATEDDDAENKSKGKKLEVAQVIAPYDATSSNQLSLLRGQLVSIRKKTPSGWWEGELQAKGKKRQIGWFPASYVKVLCGSSRNTPVSMEMTGREDYPPSDFTPGAFANAFGKDIIKVEPKPNPPPPQDPETVEALYPYTAVNDDELTFNPGDLIFVLDKEDSAWWKGSLRGVIGVFPSNYVQPKSEAKVTNLPPVVMSPEAEDSLCYSEGRNSTPWDTGGSAKDNCQLKLKNKRFTIYKCFDSPEEDKRQNVIKELVFTESSYLNDLLLVQKIFIEPMKKSLIISLNEVDLIFINWDDLVMVSSSFDKALKVRWVNTGGKNIHMISDILCHQIKQLQPYMRFCSLQSKGSVLLNKKFTEDPAWADVIRQCQEHPDIRGHTLTAFLLKPLQRLTKYPLFIKKLLLHTPPEHPDYQNTVDALQVANTLCEQVNEAVLQQDNTDKLEWMQSNIQCDNLMERLVFNSLTNTLGPRKLIHMGLLHKTKSKREIVAFLLSDFLLLTTPNKPIKTPSSLLNFERVLSCTTCVMYKKPLFLSDMSVELESESELSFVISVPGVSVSLLSSSSNERSNWLKRISLAQKHIRDTENFQLHRNQSKGKVSDVMGRVLLSVMGGVDLVIPREGTLHSFCEVSLGSQVQRTKVITSSHPKWDSAMQFLVKSLSEDVLCITVYEKGYFRPNEFLGRAEVRIQTIFENCGDRPDPQVMRLRLQEVTGGEVILKSSLQLFSRGKNMQKNELAL